jgi:sugar/nucleoside kinase (ribokinase family)
MSNILCIGNFAIDHIKETNQQTRTMAGGAGYRVCLGMALFGIDAKILTIVGNESMWERILHILNRNGIDISQIIRCEHSIEFTTIFNGMDKITGFETLNGQLMQELALKGIEYNHENYKLIHVCPFDAKDQTEIIQQAASSGSCVSSMIHYSSLDNRTREIYLETLSSLNLLFMNKDEASFLIGKDKGWEYCGSSLSERVKDGVIITLGDKGSAAFQGGSLRYLCPPQDLNIVNTLGAGDCFVGGALAGWINSQSLIMALRYGSLAATFPLTDTRSSNMINFLDFGYAQ